MDEKEFLEYLSRFSDYGLEKLRLDFRGDYLALVFIGEIFTELLRINNSNEIDFFSLLHYERKERGIK